MNEAAPPGGSDAILDRLLALHPRVIDLSLGRMERLLARLGHPEHALPPVIHIAGTNGKGSTQAMIRAGLEGTGARVHAYTSPHLAHFHERIRLAGTLIAEPLLVELLATVEAANGDIPITWFEITTAAALLAFARTPADWLLLEVGLGGRFDATNVIDRPRACVITPVSLDHQQFLGDSVAAIAHEKAGILKPGVPAVIGPQSADGLAAITAVADEVGAPLHVAGRDWHCWREGDQLVFADGDDQLNLPLPALPGPHQIENAGTAIAVLRLLGQGVPTAAMVNAVWPARMQQLRSGPLVTAAPGAEIWLDGGHNPAAGAALAATLRGMAPRPTHAICGMLNTKDAAGFLAPLAGVITGLQAVAIPGQANSLPAAATQAAAAAVGIPARVADDPGAALAAIIRDEPRARVVICGSLYLAGMVLRDHG